MAVSIVNACSQSVSSAFALPSTSSNCSPRATSGTCRVFVFRQCFGRDETTPFLPQNLQAFRRGGIGQQLSGKEQRLSTVCFATNDMAKAASQAKITPLTVKDAKVVVTSPQDEKTLRIRVDIDGLATKYAFDTVLKDLAKHAPPVPGFRRSKGGKTSTVPLNVINQLIGPRLVRKFVIEEILKATVQDYLLKENIKAKERFKTDQTNEELSASFEVGQSFGFDATLDLVKEEQPESEDVASGEDVAITEVDTVKQEIEASV